MLPSEGGSGCSGSSCDPPPAPVDTNMGGGTGAPSSGDYSAPAPVNTRDGRGGSSTYYSLPRADYPAPYWPLTDKPSTALNLMLNPCSGTGAICTWANNASISVGGAGTYFGYFATGRHRIGRPPFDSEYPGLPEAARNLKGPIRVAGWAGIAVSAGTDYLGYRAQGDSRGKSLGKAVVATGVSTVAGTIGTYAGTWAGETMAHPPGPSWERSFPAWARRAYPR